MIKIKEKGDRRNISITRGDFAILSIGVKDAEGNKIPCDGVNAAIKIQVREPPGNGTTVLFDGDVQYTDSGDAVWVIHPDDTRNVEAEEFVYDVQIQMGDDIVITFIPLSDFILMAESTEKGV